MLRWSGGRAVERVCAIQANMRDVISALLSVVTASGAMPQLEITIIRDYDCVNHEELMLYDHRR